MEENVSSNNEELASFAKLTGYQTQATASSDSVPLLDANDMPIDDHHAGVTKTQAWSSPFAKLGVVGSVFGIAVGGIALFIASVNHIKSSAQAASTPTPVAEVSPSATPVDEVGDLKTQTALETQANALQAAKAQPVTTSSSNPSAKLSSSVSQASQAPRRTLPYSSPISTSVSSFHPSSGGSGFGSGSSQQVDPMQAWQKAQQLGSYGQIAYAAVSTSSPENVSSSQSSPISATDTDYQQQQYQSDEDAIINGTSRQFSRISTGAIATGSLETPLIWAQDLDASQQAQKFAMTLSQPLMGADGSVALPSGSVLILAINGVDQSGLVSLSAVGAIVQKDSIQKLTSLPPGALTVEGTNGRPLLARQYNGVGHQIANLDRSLAIMGGLAGLGQFVTSPTSSTLSQSLTSTISSSTNRKVTAGTIIGSILNGAFSSLQQQVSQRDTQEIQSLQKRPDVWYVPEGQTLQVFVNSSFEVGL